MGTEPLRAQERSGDITLLANTLLASLEPDDLHL